MASTRNIIIGVVITGIIGLFILMVIISVWGISKQQGLSFMPVGDRIAIVEVNGVIENSEDIVRQLKKYSDDSSVPSIILRINSPGGAVAPSQEIFNQILKVREEGTYVIVSISSMAASGGYYIACAGDTIFANPGSLTGSIGAIFSFFIFEDLMDKIGIELEVVKSGDMKDVGNYAREITQREREMFQAAVDDVMNQFVITISEQRNLEIDQVEEIADGSIFTGSQALEFGLIDKLGGFEDAISLAAEMCGLGDNPRIVKEYPKRPGLFEYLTNEIKNLMKIKTHGHIGPKLQYIYK